MKKKIVVILLCSMFFTPLFLYSKNDIVIKKNNKEVPWQMYGFQKHIVSLSKYFNDIESYSSAENKKEVRKTLEELYALSKNLKGHKRLKKESFEIPIKRFEPHMKSVLLYYDAGKPKMSLWRLKASLNACSQCHSQIKTLNAPIWDIKEPLVGLTPFQKADLWFVLRSYKKAKNAFKSIIATQDPSYSEWRLSVERLLAIFVKIEKDPKGFLVELDEILKNKKLGAFHKKKYMVWRNEIVKIIKEPQVNHLDIQSFMKDVYPVEHIGYSKDVRMAYLSGFLHDYIAENTKNETAQVLYWLGIVDLEQNHQLFFDFGEDYLKSCINKFPKTKMAMKCYSALDKYITLGYTGSAGTFIPSDVNLELERLKKKLK